MQLFEFNVHYRSVFFILQYYFNIFLNSYLGLDEYLLLDIHFYERL